MDETLTMMFPTLLQTMVQMADGPLMKMKISVKRKTKSNKWNEVIGLMSVGGGKWSLSLTDHKQFAPLVKAVKPMKDVVEFERRNGMIVLRSAKGWKPEPSPCEPMPFTPPVTTKSATSAASKSKVTYPMPKPKN